MSGGYIDTQEPGEHQVVIFTFSGKIDNDQKEKWNKAVQNFKSETFLPKGALTGVTIRGEKTPPGYLPKGGKKKKS